MSADEDNRTARRGVWPFRWIDYDLLARSLQAAEAERQRQEYAEYQRRQLHARLSRMKSQEALDAFQAMCCGRSWTPEEAEQIRYMATITTGRKPDGTAWND